MVREKDGGRIALSTDARWRMASAISAAVEGISGFGFGGGGGGFFLGLGACEGARLSTGIPIKFLGDVNTDVGGAGGRENVEPGGGGRRPMCGVPEDDGLQLKPPGNIFIDIGSPPGPFPPHGELMAVVDEA